MTKSEPKPFLVELTIKETMCIPEFNGTAAAVAAQYISTGKHFADVMSGSLAIVGVKVIDQDDNVVFESSRPDSVRAVRDDPETSD